MKCGQITFPSARVYVYVVFREKNKDIYTLKDKCPFRITKPKALLSGLLSFYICYLSKRLHNEISFVHTWVRNRKA